MMDKQTRVIYASTSSHSALDLLLEAGTSHLSPHTPFRLAQSLDSYPRSHEDLAGLVEIQPGIGLNAATGLPLLLQKTLESPLPSAAIRRIDMVAAGVTCIDRRLVNLRVINASDCPSLAIDWLPESVEVLRASSSPLVRVPEGLTTLHVLQVEGCQHLAPDWLPVSSLTSLESLDVSGTKVTKIPEGSTKLREVYMKGCRKLKRHFLPESCGGFSASRTRFIPLIALRFAHFVNPVSI